MTAVEEIDKEIAKLFHRLNAKYHAEYTKLYKQSRRYKNPNQKLKQLLSKSKVFKQEKELLLNSINRKTISIMEAQLSYIANKTGINIGRIAYIADYKQINNIYIDNLDQQAIDAINQNMGLYLYEDSKTAYTNVAQALNKSIAKTRILMSETLATTTRHITEKTYKKIEKDLANVKDKDGKPVKVKYEYVGPLDGKTSPCCKAKVGKIKTMKEWQAIKSDLFTNGCHFFCRHSLDIQPVKGV